MANVVLCFPRTGFDLPGVSIDIPIALMAAASLAIQEFSVVIVDQRLDPDWRNTIKRHVDRSTLCVGVTSMTGPQIRSAIEISEYVKSISDVPVVWGGVHATLLPEQTLQNPNIDIVVIGEAEYSFLELVRALERGSSLSYVKGIGYSSKGVYTQTAPAPVLDLETLPPLPYSLVDVEQYVGSQGKYLNHRTRSLIFFSSRGCPYRCRYCCNPQIYHSTWRSMSARKTFEQAGELVIRYNLDAINFHDEEMFVNRARAEELAHLIGGRFKWWAQARMDLIGKMNLNLLECGGLEALQPGIESGSDRILKMVRKAETVETMLKTNRKLAQTGIRPLYNFMMGFPTETYGDLMDSVDLATQLLKENPLAELTGFYAFIPYPGTGLFDESVRLGFKPPDSLAGWADFNRQYLTSPWVQDWTSNILKNILVMSKFIDGRRMVRRLRNNHEIGFIRAAILKQLGRLYRYRWERHQFDNRIESRATEWLSNRLFNYRGTK